MEVESEALNSPKQGVIDLEAEKEYIIKPTLL